MHSASYSNPAGIEWYKKWYFDVLKHRNSFALKLACCTCKPLSNNEWRQLQFGKQRASVPHIREHHSGLNTVIAGKQRWKAVWLGVHECGMRQSLKRMSPCSRQQKCSTPHIVPWSSLGNIVPTLICFDTMRRGAKVFGMAITATWATIGKPNWDSCKGYLAQSEWSGWNDDSSAKHTSPPLPLTKYRPLCSHQVLAGLGGHPYKFASKACRAHTPRRCAEMTCREDMPR